MAELFVDLQIKCLVCFSEQNKGDIGFWFFLAGLVERTFLFVFAVNVFH